MPQNIFGQSSDAFTGGTNGLMFAADPNAMSQTMSQFLNPYRTQVMDNAISRGRDRRDLEMNNLQGQAAQAGAFGGARHGLVESQLNDNFGQQENEMVARLLQDGFNTSANMSAQSLGQTTAASQGLVGASATGLNMGNSVMGQQANAGSQQQSFLQALLGQGDQQFQQFANQPNTALATAMGGLQGNPLAAASTTTSQFKPGLFNYMQMGAGLMGAGK